MSFVKSSFGFQTLIRQFLWDRERMDLKQTSHQIKRAFTKYLFLLPFTLAHVFPESDIFSNVRLWTPDDSRPIGAFRAQQML